MADERGTVADQFSKPTPKVFTEGNSYTTLENIQKASEIIRYQLGVHQQITIFCEATRSVHIIRLARHFMGDLMDKEAACSAN